MKVAIVHYWLIGMRGGERVLEALTKIFPNADIFTHVMDTSKVSNSLSNKVRKQTFISKLPFSKSQHQIYLPLMPLALEQLDLTEYDLVISSEAGPAKGVITRPDALHICYCHSPMRYIWDLYHTYMNGVNPIKRAIFSMVAHKLRIWDVSSSNRVDYFIANSNFVKKRIEKAYRRPAVVIHPPVNISRFPISDKRGDYYLIVSQLVKYKNLARAIGVFSRIGKKLVVVGAGAEYRSLTTGAPENIIFEGFLPDDQLITRLQNCLALIFPGIEDFGITPLEAMACGKPVIALGKGGVVETVVNGKCGILYPEDTDGSLISAIEKFEKTQEKFIPSLIRKRAEQFSEQVFATKIKSFISDKLEASNQTQ